jgi:A/G-specific adenine glycosylase
MTRAEGASPALIAQGRSLHGPLLAWYTACRRDLPWRRTRDPYAIWVSEVMLQQTRVETVIPYYERFLARFPTAHALAEAPLDDVLALWSGLGYYRRARLLHSGARAVRDRGAVPDQRESLLEVPGIGRYTAGAIASIAHGRAVGLVDGNVARVLARLFAIEEDMRKAGLKTAERIADAIVHERDPGSWNQALMELGATVCLPRDPHCDRCPLADACRARADGRAHALPILGPKTKPTRKRVQAVVALRRGRVLLARRRGDGLFGGLWEPPSAFGDARARAKLLDDLGVGNAELVGKVVHVLSHRRLAIEVVRGNLAGSAPRTLPPSYDDARLVDSDELEGLGIATLARKILAAARFG